MDMDTECGVYMECGDTLHSVISIWIQTWVWIWSMDLHGVWDALHSTISIWTQIWLHVHISSLLHTLDIKIDLFKIGTILFIIIQGF